MWSEQQGHGFTSVAQPEPCTPSPGGMLNPSTEAKASVLSLVEGKERGKQEVPHAAELHTPTETELESPGAKWQR